MLKKILVVLLAAILSFILIVVVWFWWFAIKEQPIHSKNFIGWCVSEGQIQIRNSQSATIITKVMASKSNDTLNIEVRETTVFNPFRAKSVDTEAYKISIDPGIKFVRFGDTIKMLNEIRNCSLNH